MEKYSKKQLEEFKTKETTKTLGVENEEFIRFIEYKDYYPMRVLFVGRTYPDDKYYIYREKSDISVLEYINSGEGYLVVNEKKIMVKEGDLIYLRAGEKQNYWSSKKDPYTKTWINFQSDILDGLAAKVGLADAYIVRCPDVSVYFENIFNTLSTDVVNSMVVNMIFKTVISIILRSGDELHIDTSYSFAEKIKELLDNSVYTSRNINDIASELKYSRQQICNVFTEKFGISPVQYLIDKKIEASKMALRYSNLSINKICTMLGFSSQQYFSSVFKNKTGFKPIDYKKQFQTAK